MKVGLEKLENHEGVAVKALLDSGAEEKREVQAFMEDQLRKGYICPSKSPQTSPVYFMAKKDSTRRMVQDYQYVNQWTVKNGYPLSLIADILDGVGKRKVFTKLDLR